MNNLTSFFRLKSTLALLPMALTTPFMLNAADDDGAFVLRNTDKPVAIYDLTGSTDQLQVSPIFEADWINTDGNQNQQAMALADRLYICINPYEMSDHPALGKARPEGALYIRSVDVANHRYSVSDDILLLPSQLPDDFRFAQPYLTGNETGQFTSYYTICADDDGQLIAALAVVDFDKQSFRNLRILMYPVNVATKTLDFSGRIEIPVVEAQEIGTGFMKEIWMERISDFKGTLKSGNFSFSTMIATPNQPATQKFSYKLINVEAIAAVPQTQLTPLQLKENTGRLKSCENPDIDFWSTNPDQIILTHVSNRVPTIYSRDAGTATPYSLNNIWADDSERQYCRGQFTLSLGKYSFMLAGDESAAAAPQSRFVLFQLPDLFDEGTRAVRLAEVSDAGFDAHSDRYPYRLRQMCQATPGTAADSKIIYMYSPGCGLAGYELKLITDNGGLDEVMANSVVEWELAGNTLTIKGRNTCLSEIVVSDIAGRMFKVDPQQDGEYILIDLSRLRTGVYFVSLPAGDVLKLAL